MMFSVQVGEAARRLIVQHLESQDVPCVWRDGALLIGADSEEAAQLAVDAFEVSDAVALRAAEVTTIAAEKRASVMGITHPAEMASWSIKEREAEQFLDDGTEGTMIAAEATARGVTVQAIAQRIQANAIAFRALEAGIAGVAGKHRDALAACTTFAEVAAYDITAGWPA